MNKTANFLLIFYFLLNSLSPTIADSPKTIFKGTVRKILTDFASDIKPENFDPLPEGLKIIASEKFTGLKVAPGSLILRINTWKEPHGLLVENKRSIDQGLKVVAEVNGTFFSQRGPLGQVISDGVIPKNIRQFPGTITRSFFAIYKDLETQQRWIFGETSLSADNFIKDILPPNKCRFNEAKPISSNITGLIGGGGWLINNGKPAYNEAVKRQFFRFRPEDETACKTVLAKDSEGFLYLVVFKSGLNLYNVTLALMKAPEFGKITSAIFLDGGSSSCIVLKEKYLVPPLYQIDKCRFTSIQLLLPEKM